MAVIALLSVLPKHERRIRLITSESLSYLTFTDLSLYSVDNLDGAGVSPDVVAAMMIPGSTNQVELVLNQDLVNGALYQVSMVGTTGGSYLDLQTIDSSQTFRFGTVAQVQNKEPAVSDADLVLYGRDIIWTGADFLETATGDLAVVGGAGNVQHAILRRVTGSPLPWDPAYSANARSYVDGTEGGILPLRGRLLSQVMQDDRVKTATVVLKTEDETSFFEVSPTLVGGQAVEPISVTVPSI